MMIHFADSCDMFGLARRTAIHVLVARRLLSHAAHHHSLLLAEVPAPLDLTLTYRVPHQGYSITTMLVKSNVGMSFCLTVLSPFHHLVSRLLLVEQYGCVQGERRHYYTNDILRFAITSVSFFTMGHFSDRLQLNEDCLVGYKMYCHKLSSYFGHSVVYILLEHNFFGQRYLPQVVFYILHSWCSCTTVLSVPVVTIPPCNGKLLQGYEN